MNADELDGRVPVTLLTGFLGVGKTTLLNHLIRDPNAGRIAVVMNEFGDAGLDHDLIEESTEETILMQSGCLCCSIRGDLSKTLTSLMARRKRGELSFDRVVIETTGIADPGPIMHTMVVDNLIAPHYRTDGVVTVADAATGPSTLEKQSEAVNQIAMADLVVLSKTDLVTPTELTRFETRIAGINSSAKRIKAQKGQVPLGALFGLSAMRSNVTTDDISDWLGMAKATPDPLAGLSGFAAPDSAPAALPLPTAHAHHDHKIISASIELEHPIPANVFDYWLDSLITIRGPDILRMKGIVHVEGMGWPFVFHGVQHIFDAPVPLTSWSGTDTTSRVVVIARNMSLSLLDASLETLRLQANEPDAQLDGMMVHTTEISI
ncbi:GTPase, G3E family [Aliiroseovarius halocynthiae]|uniref:GTP-binding protein n=1 Tax=Aliiroseovarius halocynthiae TaxID=985055 RepID=A0A545SLM1_9RHOB|nr:GTP-binding protein [Aliiroseovarius halocynthiae]TQV65736.1 GTP-binding protein [Aliiroseovarius halocynthiae]SMR84001.1 GTPase, G3E family [Aliiroseovarius halocynthiae]